jgi:hypothetical protein
VNIKINKLKNKIKMKEEEEIIEIHYETPLETKQEEEKEIIKKNEKKEIIINEKDQTIFYIKQKSIEKYFSTMNVSWNPAPFHKIKILQKINLKIENEYENEHFGNNIQYLVRVKKKCQLFVLLTKHVNSKDFENDEEDIGDYNRMLNDLFITLHCFKNKKKRVFYKNDYPCILGFFIFNTCGTGKYTNNLNYLLKINIDQINDDENCFVVIISYYLNEKFTRKKFLNLDLNFYVHESFDSTNSNTKNEKYLKNILNIEKIPFHLKFKKLLFDNWNEFNSGGIYFHF